MIIGIAPGTLTFLYVGVNLRSMTELITGKRQISSVEIFYVCVTTVAIIFVVYIISRESKKQLTKILEENS